MPLAHFGQPIDVEPGTIVMWAGALADVPAGWVLCDGNNGTPNLIGRFLKSVSSATADPGATGGATSITLTETELPAHSHTAATGEDASHRHLIEKWHSRLTTHTDTGSGGVRHADGTAVNTGPAGAHTHTVTTDSEGSSTPSAYTNEPPNYQLAYIMKA